MDTDHIVELISDLRSRRVKRNGGDRRWERLGCCAIECCSLVIGAGGMTSMHKLDDAWLWL